MSEAVMAILGPWPRSIAAFHSDTCTYSSVNLRIQNEFQVPVGSVRIAELERAVQRVEAALRVQAQQKQALVAEVRPGLRYSFLTQWIARSDDSDVVESRPAVALARCLLSGKSGSLRG